MPLTIAQVYADLLSKLGIESTVGVSALVQTDCVVAINGAMQFLQTAGEDYFTRQVITLTLSAGTAIYNVPSSMQSVIGPVKWGTKPLRALNSQGEYDQFARTFLGEDDYGVGADGDPIAYWPRYLRTGTTGDICGVTILLAPAPTSPAGTLDVEVVNDAPTYTISDLTSGNSLPVAQNYTETVFLPIARMLVTRSSQFSRPDLLAQLTEDAQTAMARLGLSGGFPNVAQPGPERVVNG
jgi:hypothetical protein